MKRILILVSIIIIVLGIFALPAVGAINLHRIAVLPFDDGSIKKTWGEEFSLGKGVADELVTSLLATNRFRLIEREAVDQVLEEQNLGKDGMLDPQTAAKIGRILGVQYLIIGRVTEFSTKEDDDILANPNHNNPMGMMITRTTSRVAIDARLVDTTTAEIITSVTGTGKKKTINLGIISKQGGMSFGDKDFKKSDIGKALRQAATSTARQLAIKAYDGMAPITITGMIAYASADRIIINVGKNDGVEPGMVFKVAHKLETLKDPVTGQVIGEATEPMAEISVIQVKDKSATCVVLTKLTNVYEITIADPIESKTPVKLVLPELPPLEEEDEGPRKQKEFRIYAERMLLGEYTDESLSKDEETTDSVINLIGGQAIFGRYKLVGERSFDGEIDDPTRKLNISEYKLGYNLNPVQDVQIELFISKFNMGIKKDGTEEFNCSSWVFGADVEYELMEKTYFELSYGYGASIDFRLKGDDKSGGNLATLKTKISYYISENSAVYAGYRSYMFKIDDDQDLTGISAGMVVKF